MLFDSAAYCATVNPLTNSLGSNPGVLASAMMSPVFGSSATTDPRLPAKASSATFCTRKSIPSTRSSPAIGDARMQLRRVLAHPLHRPAGGIHENLAKSRLAVQLRLVGTLDAQLADEAGAGVLGAVDRLQVLIVDGAHVADGMNADLLQRIVARQARMDVDAGELEAVHGEARHLLLVHLKLDRNALVHLVREDGAPHGAHLLRAQHPDADELRERGIHRLVVPDLLAHQLEVEGRRIVGEHQAVAIEDQPAARRNRLGADAVALRQLRVVLVLQDLQIEQPPCDGEQQNRGEHAGDDAADREQPVLGERILDLRSTAAHHRNISAPANLEGGL